METGQDYSRVNSPLRATSESQQCQGIMNMQVGDSGRLIGGYCELIAQIVTVAAARRAGLSNSAFVAGDALHEMTSLPSDSFDCVLATDCAYQYVICTGHARGRGLLNMSFVRQLQHEESSAQRSVSNAEARWHDRTHRLAVTL